MGESHFLFLFAAGCATCPRNLANFEALAPFRSVSPQLAEFVLLWLHT